MGILGHLKSGSFKHRSSSIFATLTPSAARSASNAFANEDNLLDISKEKKKHGRLPAAFAAALLILSLLIAPPAFAEDSQFEDCYASAGAMGWVLCPAISAASRLFDGIYEKVEKNYLRIQSTEIFKSDSGVSTAWGRFRDLSNVVFVIFLLVIIMSQLTGVGIDNYGIKRLLPKLITTALLVNLSYIICEVAVDVANVIGASLKTYLESNLGSGITSATVDSTGDNFSTGAFAGASAVTIAIGILAVWTNPGLIVTLLLFLLSMVVSVIFLWVILIARQAGVIIGIVLSPLAFVCILFPNTEKIYKRWFDLMKGLLLLYPICSIVVGGGKLAGAILHGAGGDNEGWSLAAMIVQVAPYFMIPSLLRSSLNAINGLGNKIGRVSSGLQRSANNRMQRSELANRSRTGLNAAGVRSRVKAGQFTRRLGAKAGQKIAGSKVGQGVRNAAASAGSAISNSKIGAAGRAISGSAVGRAVGGAGRVLGGKVAGIGRAVGKTVSGAAINRRARAMEAQNKQQQADVNARAIYLDRVNPDETPSMIREAALNALDNNNETDFATAMERLDSQSQKKVMDEYASRIMRGHNGETVDANGNLIGYANATTADRQSNVKRAQMVRRVAQGNKDLQRLLATKSTDVNNYVNDNGGYKLDARGRVVDSTSNTGKNLSHSDYNDYSAKLEDFQGMSTEAVRRFFASAAENGQNVGTIAESVINSDSQIARSIMNDPDKANIFRAAAQASRSGVDVRSAIGASVADSSLASGRRIVSGSGAKSTAASFADQYTAGTMAKSDWIKGGINKLMDGVASGNVTTSDMRSMLDDADLQQTFNTTEGRQVQQAMKAAVQYSDDGKGNEQSFATEYVSAQASGNMAPITTLAADYDNARKQEAADARLAERQEALNVRRDQQVEAEALHTGRQKVDNVRDSANKSQAPTSVNNLFAAPAGFSGSGKYVRTKNGEVHMLEVDKKTGQMTGRHWNANTGLIEGQRIDRKK